MEKERQELLGLHCEATVDGYTDFIFVKMCIRDRKKSETLIEKIHTMTSPGQVAKLKRNNYVTVVFTLVTVPLMALRIWQSLSVADWMLAFC